MSQTNAADRKQIRAAEKAAAISARERGEVVIALMSTAPGRRFVWDRLADASIFATTFSTDPIQMAFNEGQRNQGLTLLDEIIRSCPDQFILAMRESNARRTESDVRTSSSPDARTGERTGGEEPGWEPEDQPDSLAGSEARGNA
jgi:hypothetical protein